MPLRPESNGVSGPDDEDWTAEEVTHVAMEVMAGLNTPLVPGFRIRSLSVEPIEDVHMGEHQLTVDESVFLSFFPPNCIEKSRLTVWPAMERYATELPTVH